MTFETIILGSGAMGSAAAWQLSRRGQRVLAIDQFSPPHTLGSSHGHTRMTRSAYYEHPDYVPLLLRAHQLWRELEDDTATSLLHFVGGLYIGPENSELITGSLASAKTHNLAHELLSPEDLRRRYPQFSPAAGSIALLEKRAGYLLVENCITTLLSAATTAGAATRFKEKVLSFEERPGHVTVQTDRGKYEAGQLIVTAGAWATKLLGDRIPTVRPTRQTLGWFAPPHPNRFESTPVWAFDIGAGHLLYGFPILADRPGLKVAHHAPGPTTDPDQVHRAISPSDIESLRRLARQYIPDVADAPLTYMTTCLYENSPDGHFLLGRLSDRLIVAAGFSGHGFKFAPSIGEVLAELATGKIPTHNVQFLHPRRLMQL